MEFILRRVNLHTAFTRASNVSITRRFYGLRPILPQPRIAPYRCVTSTTYRNATIKPEIKSGHDDFVAATEYVRPCATWLSPIGVSLDPHKIIDQLPRVQAHQSPHLRTVLFFVTPQYAYLFDPGNNFHHTAINRVFSSPAGDTQRRSIVAVVDALPALSNQAKRAMPEVYGYDGIAVCVSTDLDTRTAPQIDEAKPPLITFRANNPFTTPNDEHLVTSYQALAANTIFTNGRNYTMFKQQWTKPGDTQHESDSWVEDHDNPREYLSKLELSIYENSYKSLPAIMNVELLRLTRPAVVVYSMGNIIRQIKTRDGETIPASQELEHIIPPLVKTKHLTRPTAEVRVFAVVYPRKLYASRRALDEPYKERLFAITMARGEEQSTLKRDHLHQLLISGARIYRVTSGGAGWGNKAGLLSLEPSTGYADTPDSDFSIFPNFNIYDDEVRMPGGSDLFPPGHVVQFMASWHDPTDNQKNGITINEAHQPDLQWLHDDYFATKKLQKFCIGTVTSSEALANHQPTKDEATKQTGFVFCPNRFGFLSYKAMSLAVEPYRPRANRLEEQLGLADSLSESDTEDNVSNKVIHSTLIDVPNSAFVAVFPAGGKHIDESEFGELLRKTSKNVLIPGPALRLPQSWRRKVIDAALTEQTTEINASEHRPAADPSLAANQEQEEHSKLVNVNSAHEQQPTEARKSPDRMEESSPVEDGPSPPRIALPGTKSAAPRKVRVVGSTHAGPRLVESEVEDEEEAHIPVRRVGSPATVRLFWDNDARFATGPVPQSESEDTIDHMGYASVRGAVESDSALFKSYQEKALIGRERIKELLEGLSADLKLDESWERDSQSVEEVVRFSTADLMSQDREESNSRSVQEIVNCHPVDLKLEDRLVVDRRKDEELARNSPAGLVSEKEANHDGQKVEEVVRDSPAFLISERVEHGGLEVQEVVEDLAEPGGFQPFSS